MDDELEQLTAAILAAEDWATEYQNAPDQYATLIKNTAKLQRLVIQHLKQLADKAPTFIDWYEYSNAVYEQKSKINASANVQAYNVDVVINNDSINQEDQNFIKIIFDTVAATVALGSDSMVVEHGMNLGLSSVSTIIQSLTTQQLANLVGMKVNKDGTIVPNPNAAYSIDDTTRDRIAQSIKTSIQLGENQQEATARLKSVIADSDRAEMIAYTETVRAYAEGRAAYAQQSGATGKYNSDSSAIDICADNTAQGTIPADQDFVSGDQNEPFHPNCKCIVTYVYGVQQFDD